MKFFLLDTTDMILIHRILCDCPDLVIYKIVHNLPLSVYKKAIWMKYGHNLTTNTLPIHVPPFYNRGNFIIKTDAGTVGCVMKFWICCQQYNSEKPTKSPACKLKKISITVTVMEPLPSTCFLNLH